MGLSPLMRNVVSRTAMLVLGAAMLYGGIACYRTAVWLEGDYEQRFGRDADATTGAELPGMAACVLAPVGALLLLGGVLPSSWLYRLPLFGDLSSRGNSAASQRRRTIQ